MYRPGTSINALRGGQVHIWHITKVFGDDQPWLLNGENLHNLRKNRIEYKLNLKRTNLCTENRENTGEDIPLRVHLIFPGEKVHYL